LQFSPEKKEEIMFIAIRYKQFDWDEGKSLQLLFEAFSSAFGSQQWKYKR
jgi:hypothetical protein